MRIELPRLERPETLATALASEDEFKPKRLIFPGTDLSIEKMKASGLLDEVMFQTQADDAHGISRFVISDAASYKRFQENFENAMPGRLHRDYEGSSAFLSDDEIQTFLDSIPAMLAEAPNIRSCNDLKDNPIGDRRWSDRVKRAVYEEVRVYSADCRDDGPLAPQVRRQLESKLRADTVPVVYAWDKDEELFGEENLDFFALSAAQYADIAGQFAGKPSGLANTGAAAQNGEDDSSLMGQLLGYVGVIALGGGLGGYLSIKLKQWDDNFWVKISEKTRGFLKTHGDNLIDKAKKGDLNGAFRGRKEQIGALIAAMTEPDGLGHNWSLLMGEAGTGKTEIVHELARRIARGQLPVLERVELWSLSPDSLSGGGELSGGAKKVKQLARAVAKYEKQRTGKRVFIFIDEAHRLIDVGKHSNSDQSDVAEALKQEKGLRLIGATTEAEYKKYMDLNPPFKQRLGDPIIVPSSQGEELSLLIRDQLFDLEKKPHTPPLHFATDTAGNIQILEIIIALNEVKSPKDAEPRRTLNFVKAVMRAARAKALASSANSVEIRLDTVWDYLTQPNQLPNEIHHTRKSIADNPSLKDAPIPDSAWESFPGEERGASILRRYRLMHAIHQHLESLSPFHPPRPFAIDAALINPAQGLIETSAKPRASIIDPPPDAPPPMDGPGDSPPPPSPPEGTAAGESGAAPRRKGNDWVIRGSAKFSAVMELGKELGKGLGLGLGLGLGGAMATKYLIGRAEAATGIDVNPLGEEGLAMIGGAAATYKPWLSQMQRAGHHFASGRKAAVAYGKFVGFNAPVAFAAAWGIRTVLESGGVKNPYLLTGAEFAVSLATGLLVDVTDPRKAAAATRLATPIANYVLQLGSRVVTPRLGAVAAGACLAIAGGNFLMTAAME